MKRLGYFVGIREEVNLERADMYKTDFIAHIPHSTYIYKDKNRLLKKYITFIFIFLFSCVYIKKRVKKKI